MIIKHVERGLVERAADRVAVRVEQQARDPERFVLRPERGGRFQRHAPGSWRRLNAVCFHGHLVFLRELYALAPDAVVVTAMATYRSLADLERGKDAVAGRNIGSLARPFPYGGACECASDPEALGRLAASGRLADRLAEEAA